MLDSYPHHDRARAVEMTTRPSGEGQDLRSQEFYRETWSGKPIRSLYKIKEWLVLHSASERDESMTD
jgi:hypothetical protein